MQPVCLKQRAVRLQDRVQPPQPAHGASFVGERVELLVDRQGHPRRILASHSNCYLGTLRKQVGACAPCPAARWPQGAPALNAAQVTAVLGLFLGPQIHPICRQAQLVVWFGPALGELADACSECTSWVVQLAEMMGMGVDPAQLRLISGGKDYSSNAMVLRDVSFGNSTIHFQVRRETGRPYRAALPLVVWRPAEFQRADLASSVRPMGAEADVALL